MENITFENLPAAISELLRKVNAIELCLQSKQIEQPDQLLTVEQFSEFATLAKSTIYGMLSKGEIENLKRGKRVYFEKRVVLEYLKAGRRKSYSQLAEEGRK